MDEHFYLGIDAGGSRCKARLADCNGRVLCQAELGPANTWIGVEPLRQVLIEVAEQAFSLAGLPAETIARTHAGLGIAGLSRRGGERPIDEMELPFFDYRIDTDAAVAQLGAYGGADGAILILGTGSVAYSRIGDVVTVIGGYGFPISDEGSGAALGLSAVRHALRALDGRTKPTPLSHAISSHFSHDTRCAIKWMDQATPRDYASFAPTVLNFADDNDEIARLIVEDAAKHVERFIETIFAKGAPACALVGGVSERMRQWLRTRTTERLVDALGDGLDGALQLAGLDVASARPLETRAPYIATE
ncbi:MAG: BadF/BadG/BcrA/BcrD ATPase family protein [Pseudomonadota bacterium]